MRKLLLVTLVFTAVILGTAGEWKNCVALELDYPTVQGRSIDPTEETGIAAYIEYIYTFALAVVGIAAFIALTYGGVIYMLSDSVTKKEDAMGWIKSALAGLVLALFAYLILYTINPDLVGIEFGAQAVSQPSSPGLQPSRQPSRSPDLGLLPSAYDPSQIEKMTHARAVAALGLYDIGVKPGVSLRNVNKATIDGIIALAKMCPSCAFVVTSGTEGIHIEAGMSHIDGFKLDIQTNNEVDNFFMGRTENNPLNIIAGRLSDRTPTYTTYSVPGLVEVRFLDERNVSGVVPHWDVRFAPLPPN